MTGFTEIAAAASIGGSIYQGVSGYGSSKAAAKQAKNSATLAMQQAESDADKVRRDTYLQISANKAAYGASGIISNTGSAALVQITQAQEGELDAQNILRQGIINSNASLIEAKQYQSKSLSSLVGGAAGAADGFNLYQSTLPKQSTGVITGKSQYKIKGS